MSARAQTRDHDSPTFGAHQNPLVARSAYLNKVWLEHVRDQTRSERPQAPRGWVAPSTTAGAQPERYALSQRDAQTHQRSPGDSPRKPHSGRIRGARSPRQRGKLLPKPSRVVVQAVSGPDVAQARTMSPASCNHEGGRKLERNSRRAHAPPPPRREPRAGVRREVGKLERARPRVGVAFPPQRDSAPRRDRRSRAGRPECLS
jgi:hypothetical protein